MSDNKLIAGHGVLIGRDYWDTPVLVDVRAYLRLSRQLDRQLRQLVVRWSHAASPEARGVPVVRNLTQTPSPPINPT